MALEVSVDPDLCIGSGDCVRTVPAAFELDEQLGVSLVTGLAMTSDPELVLRAARMCPTQAIAVARDGAALHGSVRAARTGSEAPR